MQLIDLSDVENFSAGAFLLFWLVATIVAVVTAYSIAPEKKMKWFRQRSDNGFMVRRGWFGNFSLLGVPTSKEGFAITLGIFVVSGLIWAFLVYLLLPILGYQL